MSSDEDGLLRAVNAALAPERILASKTVRDYGLFGRHRRVNAAGVVIGKDVDLVAIAIALNLAGAKT